jgi:hypothetical protein
VLRAELKGAIRKKIAVMTKRMATADEIRSTYRFFHDLLTGQSVVIDVESRQKTSLRGNNAAIGWAADFVIDTYLVRRLLFITLHWTA